MRLLVSQATRQPADRASAQTTPVRRLIVQARLAFAANGHDAVSVQRDVLEPSGVSNGSLYHQFSDKTDLLVAVLEEAANAACATIATTLRERTGNDNVDPDLSARLIASLTYEALID